MPSRPLALCTRCGAFTEHYVFTAQQHEFLRCRPCSIASASAWNRKNKERVNERQRIRRQLCPTSQ